MRAPSIHATFCHVRASGILGRRCVAMVAMGAALGLAGPGCGSRQRKADTRGSDDGNGAAAAAAQEAKRAARAEFDLFVFGRVLGTIAPCGCTTEPLGGLQFAFGHIEATSDPDARLVLEPGSFLFPVPEGPEWPSDEASWNQAYERASLLTERFSSLGEHFVAGVGPTDVASPKGTSALTAMALPRVAANVTDLAALEAPAHRIVTLRSHGLTWRVGVTSVVDPAIEGAATLGTVSPPELALRAQVAALDREGADFTVAVAHGERGFAEGLAREVPEVDLVVAGVPEGLDRERLGAPPTQIGATWVVEPGAQLQTMTRLHLSIDPDEKGVPAPSSWTVAPPDHEVREELARLETRLAKFRADPSADPAFLQRLEAQRGELERRIGAPPEADAVATFEQVKVTCKLPVDEAAKKAMAAYDKALAEQNVERFRGVRPPAPAPGKPGYAGMAACEDCHAEAVEFWKTTRHAGAYETLVGGNKQYDLTCVGCHVTGFREPGGSEVVENEGLVDVQCESCHGPGSVHVDDGESASIRLEAPAELCATACHTPEHSDTFQYEAYLRDVLGPGHGEARREALGDGPTGHELRQAGLEKAGGSCKEKLM